MTNEPKKPMDDITRFYKEESDYLKTQSKAESPNASEEDKKAAMECCRKFKLRCKYDFDGIPQKLDDPGRADDHAALKQIHTKASEYLRTLEQKCPGDADPPIEPPAERTFQPPRL